MSLNLDRSLDYLKMLIIVGILILVGQRFGYGISIFSALPGMIIVILISFLALTIKDSFPNLHFPAFAWASLTALILSMPFMPTAELFLKYTNEVNFLGTTTPILAYAGISVGNKIEELRKLSWKVFIVAVAVFIGTYFGSAIVAHLVLKMQGII
ncbi:hypothetical protein C8C77_10564 [Halanaerobium saccharolyticum]|uniref:DUF340 domain-containing protein n=1 Tax=Halanaerobium saccharolyticum TaxID=43595 RepID=A0A4R7Z5K3_9FIRM|nr:hypothetical protein [Halanaerobium saccharolyticum]RAK12502.1 hypothetical protein C7958_10164 [Halanaerobium saccharolyticum]TDW06428.1 hypothetical protein C8C77_10564 [Halanaerobium saccharolyticum]TDX61676.1 hypothetical protein C7956_10564 [Halanaerobium saccharolyticum]